jgi:hypothetical protein
MSAQKSVSTANRAVKVKGGSPYRVARRTKKKRGGGDLSGYAVDLTIRVNGEEAYFLQDHNSDRNVMPHNNRKELIETLLQELERNHVEHFGRL